MALKSHMLFLGAACLATAVAQGQGLLWKEFQPRLDFSAGHIVNGEYKNGELDFFPLNRNVVALEQEATFEDTWAFKAGLEGMIWWPFQPGGSQPHERSLRVDMRISEVRARRLLGSSSFVEFGYFPYKYNKDARNLGEYLHRSGTYPGIVRTTDNFHLIGNAYYQAYGAHARYRHGSGTGGWVSHDLTLFSEQTVRPIGDLSPGYELSAGLSLFEIGVGAVYNRLIGYQPSGNRSHDFENGYFVVDTGAPGEDFRGPYVEAPLVIRNLIEANTGVVSSYYYTQRGLKLMARAAVDLGFLLPEEHRNPGDLRVFTEAALLGVENQPFFYDNRMHRVPVMVGVNLPTWRVLNVLSVQAEYNPSRFTNSYDYNYYGHPIWTVDQSYDPKDNRRDDWKWSVNARKQVNRLLSVEVQVANDYLRLPEFNTNPSETPVTQTPENWYYLLRLECSL